MSKEQKLNVNHRRTNAFGNTEDFTQHLQMNLDQLNTEPTAYSNGDSSQTATPREQGLEETALESPNNSPLAPTTTPTAHDLTTTHQEMNDLYLQQQETTLESPNDSPLAPTTTPTLEFVDQDQEDILYPTTLRFLVTLPGSC